MQLQQQPCQASVRPMFNEAMPAHRSIRVLDETELSEVSGGVGVPGAVAGAVFGGVAYAISAGYSGSGSLAGFATAVGGGALVGATGGALSAGSFIWGFNATVVAGTASGVVSSDK